MEPESDVAAAGSSRAWELLLLLPLTLLSVDGGVVAVMLLDREPSSERTASSTNSLLHAATGTAMLLSRARQIACAGRREIEAQRASDSKCCKQRT
jgi:hypothetical protein